MSELMTFREMRQIPEINLYPENLQSETALQSLINEWFDDRRVNDNVLFPRQFKRQIEKVYPQYFQLLRVQPGIAEYDWLVENYNETQRKTLRTPNLTETTQGGDTVTHNTAISVNESNVLSGSDITTGTGNITHTQDKSRNEQNSGTDTDTRTGTETHNENVTRSRSLSGSEGTDPQNPKTTTSTATHPTFTSRTTEASDTVQHSHDGSQNTHLEKTNPMSISYVNGQTGQGNKWGSLDNPTLDANADKAMSPGLDWTSPSAQSEDNVANAGYSHTEQDPTKNYSENTQSYSGTDSIQTIETGGRVSSQSETVTTQGESDRIVHNTTDAHTHGHNVNVTERGTTDAEARNITDTTTYGKTDTHTGTTNHTGTDSTQSSSTHRTTGDDSIETRQQYTGRNTAPADLLAKAKSFIENTNAWNFLYGELNKCFMGVY